MIEKGMKVIRPQYKVDAGLIDILMVDERGTKCVVELKGGFGDGRVVHQAISYPTGFNEDVRMIVIAPYIKPDILKSLNLVNQCIRKVEVYKFIVDEKGFYLKPYIINE